MWAKAPSRREQSTKGRVTLSGGACGSGAGWQERPGDPVTILRSVRQVPGAQPLKAPAAQVRVCREGAQRLRQLGHRPNGRHPCV